MPTTLTELQRIPTTGARAVEAVTVDGLALLAVPQLARDVPGTPAGMNGGDSDVELALLRWTGQEYESYGALPVPGGEDAEFFGIDGQPFLATASIRTGSGPYEFAADSTIWAWRDGGFAPFQKVQTYAAKQWRYWSVDDRHFLGLAQGVAAPGHDEAANHPSLVYEWDGAGFAEAQRIPSRWAYNWHAFTIGDTSYVAHADHLDASVLYRWDGTRLVPHQELIATAGRAFATFERDGEQYLLAAGLATPPRLLRWTGERFAEHQALTGLGARELAVIEHGSRLFVVRVNFILGTPADPQPCLISQLYEWDGAGLAVVAEFPTTGGTDVTVVGRDDAGVRFVVSNALSPDVRFAAHTVLYRLAVT